jgi:hypothetical protein
VKNAKPKKRTWRLPSGKSEHDKALPDPSTLNYQPSTSRQAAMVRQSLLCSHIPVPAAAHLPGPSLSSE